MTTFQDLGLLLLRVGFGALLVINHGWGKLQRLLSGHPIGFQDPLGIGPELSFYLVLRAELLCATLLALGLLKRLALIPLIVNFAVIFFIAHGDKSFGDRELPLLFLVAYVGLFFTGPGRYTLRSLVAGGREPSSPAVSFLTR